MSEELTKALENVYRILKSETHDHCIAVSIFFNSEGYQIEYMTRTPESLKRDGVSMRNIRGDFIKD